MATAPARQFSIARLEGRRLIGLKGLLWALLLFPIARVVYAGFTDALGPNPQETIQRSTGWWTLALLCITLCITPLRRLTGWPWWLRLRRLLGLFAFFYATLHLLTWAWWDQAFVIGDMWHDFIKRPFITVGIAAYALMVLLAATSPRFMSRRLGGRRWQALHRTIYLAVSLGALHYWWMRSAKNNLFEPSVFAAIVAALLAVRLFWAIRARVSRAR